MSQEEEEFVDDRGNKKKAKSKDVAWQYHPARMLIRDRFENGQIPLSYSDASGFGPRAVYDSLIPLGDPAMNGVKYNEEFTRHLRDLRMQVVGCSDRARDDEDAYKNFRMNHPTQKVDGRGRPRWQGSEAEALLKQDMDDGIHKQFDKPSLFYQSRPEYQKFQLDVFRGHIDQEKRLRNYYNYLEKQEAEEKKKMEKARKKVVEGK
ncbi:unknown protein [Seminavis robusta]|uniref:Uncharacterized protein n=1 Tax=Seminavis robusta TaxID=568900 RepID=A0A9N8ELG6_9STRA|nr:unknown protein [Seminavis robusta]|eukprot:Sro1478_g276070.1 n/a (206) ;mRNA; r:24913-25530